MENLLQRLNCGEYQYFIINDTSEVHMNLEVRSHIFRLMVLWHLMELYVICQKPKNNLKSFVHFLGEIKNILFIMIYNTYIPYISILMDTQIRNNDFLDGINSESRVVRITIRSTSISWGQFIRNPFFIVPFRFIGFEANITFEA